MCTMDQNHSYICYFPFGKIKLIYNGSQSSVWKHSSIDVFQDRGATIKLNNVLFLYVNVFKWQTEITLSNQDRIHLNLKNKTGTISE